MRMRADAMRAPMKWARSAGVAAPLGDRHVASFSLRQCRIRARVELSCAEFGIYVIAEFRNDPLGKHLA